MSGNVLETIRDTVQDVLAPELKTPWCMFWIPGMKTSVARVRSLTRQVTFESGLRE